MTSQAVVVSTTKDGLDYSTYILIATEVSDDGRSPDGKSHRHYQGNAIKKSPGVGCELGVDHKGSGGCVPPSICFLLPSVSLLVRLL